MRTLACAWCISSAFGDRSFTWPYLGLIVAPFLVFAAIAATLAWHAGIRPRALIRRLTDRVSGRRAEHHESMSHKETT
jgi:hypothetical protein